MLLHLKFTKFSSWRIQAVERRADVGKLMITQSVNVPYGAMATSAGLPWWRFGSSEPLSRLKATAPLGQQGEPLRNDVGIVPYESGGSQRQPGLQLAV